MKPPRSTKAVTISWFITSFIVIYIQTYVSGLTEFMNQHFNGLKADSMASSEAFKKAFLVALIIAGIRFIIQEKRWDAYRKQFPDGIIPIITVKPLIKYTSSTSAIILAIAVALLVLITGIYLIYF